MSEGPSQTALITGATSGIGYALAKEFVRHHYNLVLVARNENKLNEIASHLQGISPLSQITTVVQDLVQPDCAQKIFEVTQKKGIQIDVLVNDAGMAVHGDFKDTDIRQEDELIQLNIRALVHLTKIYLKEMLSKNGGKILQVSSIVSVMSVPREAVYAASKAFVLSFSDSLRQELKGTAVTISTLLPGATDTAIFDKANAENARFVAEGHLEDPDFVAKEGFEGLMQGKDTIIPGFINKAYVTANKWLPNGLLSFIKEKMMEDVK